MTTRIPGSMRTDLAVCVTDFGADPTGVADSTAAIQAAINAVHTADGGTVYLPTGTYDTSSPILLYDGVILLGARAQSTKINKTTNTVGSGTSTSPSASAPDNYAIDSIVSVWHNASGYTYNAQIRNLTLIKQTYAGTSSYGIFAPRLSQSTLEDVHIQNVDIGYFTYNAWMCVLRRVTVQACAIGYDHVNDGTGAGTGTSCIFENCWVNFDNTVVAVPIYAFSIFGLTYSSFISCGSDNGIPAASGTQTVISYFFNTCNAISVNGCGVEAHQGGAIYCASSNVSFTAFRSQSMTGNVAGTAGTVFADTSSTITLTNCSFAPVTAASGTFYNWVIQGGASVIEINPAASPSGGSAFTGYSGGASKTRVVGTGTTITNASGTFGTPTKLNGSVAATAATPVTFYTITAAGAYYVYVLVGNSGVAYQSAYLVTTEGVTATATALKAGANLTVSMSGLNMQVTCAATTSVLYSVVAAY